MPHRRTLLALTLAATSLPALAQTLTLAASPASVYANAPVTLTTLNLPPAATGTVLFTDASTTLANVTITGSITASYQAFGDSITVSPSYADLIAANYSLTLTNQSIANTIACDILPSEILANNLGPSQQSSPLSSIMTGSNDAVLNTLNYDPTFIACHQAALAWLAITRESKLLAADATILSGTWRTDANTLTNASGGAARYTITTSGAPIYLWQLLSDSLPGTFTLTLDGLPSATIYQTQPTPAIGSHNTPQLRTFGLIRLPVLPGTHTLDITALSGTVGILAVATPSLTLHPTVLVPDVPSQLPGNTTAIAHYSADILADATLLAADGLDLRYIPTQAFLLGTPAEMLDAINPNSLGQSHLATAFNTLLGSLSTTPFTAFTNIPPAATATFANPGRHVLTSTYSGDSNYAAATASTIITILAQQPTLTRFSTPTTHVYAGSAVPFTAVVSPSSATGTITLYDGTQLLAQLPQTPGAVVYMTSTLAVGIHTLTAVYSGDTADLSSASPQLAIQIEPTPTTLTLASIPATAPYGAATTLTAAITPASATGAITFYDGTQTLATTNLASGSATISPVLTIGTHTLTAAYSGDTSDLPTSSLPIATTIQSIATTTTLTQPSTALFATPIALTATVTPTSATGLVQFADTTGILASALLVNGIATTQLSTLTAGTHALRATYLGDTLDAPSTSTAALTTITPNSTTTTLTLAQTAIPAGGLITFNVRVSSPSNPTGTVTILSNSTLLATGSLANAGNGAAYATLTLPATTLGATTVTASYSGDANDLASTSAALPFTVIPTPTTATLIVSATSVPPQSTITLTTSIASAAQIPTGSIVFASNGNTLATIPLNSTGQASTTLVSPTLGTYALTATFVPTGLFAAASAPPQTLTVTLPVALTLTPATLNPAPGSTSTATLAITPLSGFSGPIQTQCQSPASYITCTMDAPASIATPSHATIHIIIPASNAAYLFPFLLLPLVFRRGRHRNRLIVLLSIAVLSTSSCADDGNFFSIPEGSTPIALNVTAAGTTVTTTLTINIAQ